MADNTELNAGSGGDTISTDDIAGVKVQRVKVQYGTDGSATDVSDTNPMPVDDAGGSLTVDNGGTFAVQDAAAEASLAIIDDWDESDRAKVNPIVGQAGVAAGAGAVSATVQRVTLASDDPAVALLGTIDSDTSSLAGCVGGTEVQVDVVGSLPAGTNAIGKLSANSGVDIGDVDVTSLPTTVHSADFDTGAGTDTTLAFGIAVPASGGAAVVPGDATAGLKVDLGADNDVTVTGSVTANAGTNLNTSALALESGGNLASAVTALQIVDDWDESDRAKVNPIVGQAGVAAGAGSVSATVQRMTLASDDPGVALLGTIDADTSSLAGCVGGTELQVDVVGSLPAGTNAIGKLAANSGVDIGDVDVTSIAAGANLIGDVGLSGARTSGGVTPYQNLDVDETEDDVKTSAGQVYFIHAMNLSNGKRYLKFYNATAANVTVGSTTPVLTFAIPTQGDTNGAGFTLAIPNGIAFSTAICIAATTGFAVADTGAPGANEVIVNLGYA